MDLICIDLEASGLGPQSYPIEIAWKNDFTGEQDSFLINPESTSNWDYWDEYAEEMHGLDRETIVSEGLDILDACKRLNETLKGQVLISDACEFDRFWMNRLFDAAKVKPAFKMAGLEGALTKEQMIQFGFLAKAQRRKHRAMDDVDDILTCIHAVTLENKE